MAAKLVDLGRLRICIADRQCETPAVATGAEHHGASFAPVVHVAFLPLVLGRRLN
jgi:hypothetical protein